jgi:hypothetical protein
MKDLRCRQNLVTWTGPFTVLLTYSIFARLTMIIYKVLQRIQKLVDILYQHFKAFLFRNAEDETKCIISPNKKTITSFQLLELQ